MSELKGKKIAVLGDSVAKGIVYDDTRKKYRHVNNSFVEIVSEKIGFETVNMARFGCTIIRGREIFKKNRERIKDCSAVIMEFGGNDCNFRWHEVSESPDQHHDPTVIPEIFEAEYRKLITQVKNEGCMPVLLSLPPIEHKRFFDWISHGLSEENILRFLQEKEFIYRWHEMYNSIVFGLAQSENVKILDIRKDFLEHKTIQDYICSDGMHPNEKGHNLIGNALLDGGLITDL